MQIIIWGVGERGKKVKKLCDQHGWKVKGWTDNNNIYWKDGNLIEGLPVIPPCNLFEINEGIQIWIATTASEVYVQAKGIHNNVLGWEFVEMLLNTMAERPNFPWTALQEENLANCRVVSSRIEFLKMFIAESKHWKMVELGVACGNFSQLILMICNPEKLYLIDPWEEGEYGEGYQTVQDKFKQEIEEGVVEIRRGYSTDCLKEFADGELDWVYIDTVHDDYELIKEELELCSVKVASNGYICGHDYAKYDVYCGKEYCVYDAVNEFAVKFGYEFIYLTLEEHGLNSFCLRKIVRRD